MAKNHLNPERHEKYSSINALNNPIYNDIPSWLRFFVQDWQNKQPGQKMAYLEGWQPDINTGSYNVPAQMLSKSPQAVQWEDVGPAGARWHGYSRTPSGGQWLKAPWHPTHHYEDEYELQALLRKVLGS